MPKRRKKTDRAYFIVSLAVIFISLVVGYAIFSETLNITGTAQTTGNFNVEFFGTSITSFSKCTPTSTLSGDKNTLTISIPDLTQPGATAKINVIVKNTGNIAATLLSVDVTGNTNTNVKVVYPTWTTGVNLAAGATYSFNIDVTWDMASTVGDVTLPFSVALNYQQGV